MYSAPRPFPSLQAFIFSFPSSVLHVEDEGLNNSCQCCSLLTTNTKLFSLDFKRNTNTEVPGKKLYHALNNSCVGRWREDGGFPEGSELSGVLLPPLPARESPRPAGGSTGRRTPGRERLTRESAPYWREKKRYL